MHSETLAQPTATSQAVPTGRSGERLRARASRYDVERQAYAVGMWDVLTWHDGTLAIAWWAVIVLVVALLSIGGTAAARRK